MCVTGLFDLLTNGLHLITLAPIRSLPTRQTSKDHSTVVFVHFHFYESKPSMRDDDTKPRDVPEASMTAPRDTPRGSSAGSQGTTDRHPPSFAHYIAHTQGLGLTQ